jgi:hypothetical protein
MSRRNSPTPGFEVLRWESDPVLRLTIAPLPERALWPAIKRRGQLIEFYVTASGVIPRLPIKSA